MILRHFDITVKSLPSPPCPDGVNVVSMDTKLYRRHTGYPGGLKTASAAHVFRKDPTQLLTKAIKGMLPKTPLGNGMARKLRVYVGSDHPHQAQRPEPISL